MDYFERLFEGCGSLSNVQTDSTLTYSQRMIQQCHCPATLDTSLATHEETDPATFCGNGTTFDDSTKRCTAPLPATVCGDRTIFDESTQHCKPCPYNVCETPTAIPGWYSWKSNLNNCSSEIECADQVRKWLAWKRKGNTDFMVGQRKNKSWWWGYGIGSEDQMRDKPNHTSWGFKYDGATKRISGVVVED